MDEKTIRPLEFVGSSRKDLKAMPDAVRRTFGTALFLAQGGEKAEQAKPFKGFRGAGVLEVIERWHLAVRNGIGHPGGLRHRRH